MKTITDRAFKEYAEPLINSIMVGDVQSLRYEVIDDMSQDRDWVAKTRFKNNPNVSVYNGTAYILDILHLCRLCNACLVTEDIFEVCSTYYWINPIFRSQFLGVSGTDADYDSMLYTADKQTQQFIRDKMPKLNELQLIVLELIRYYTMKLTNHTPRGINPYDEFDKTLSDYKLYMQKYYKEAYKTARRFKAQTYLVDKDGFIILEQTKPDKEMY